MCKKLKRECANTHNCLRIYNKTKQEALEDHRIVEIMELHQNKVSSVCAIAFLFCFFLTFPLKANERYTNHSVLSSGNWVKIQIENNGIYKLTYAELKKMGFSDPSKVAVYGYGGWLLDEDFQKPYVDDLPAVPVVTKDDYILFYGRGTTKWEAAKGSSAASPGNFIHTNNPYSTYAYYFLTDAAQMKVAELSNSSDKTASQRIETFDDHLLHEKDLISINYSGRRLFEMLSQPAQVFKDFGDPAKLGIVEDDIYLDGCFVAKATSSNMNGEIKISFAGDESTHGPYSLQSIDSYRKGIDINLFRKYTYKPGDNLNVKLEYLKGGRSSIDGYIDYIRLHVKRKLKAYDEPYTFFRSFKAIGHVSRFVIEEATPACVVMDITDPANPTIVETELTGSTLSFTILEYSTLREFVLVRTDRADFPVPVSKGKVVCPDLHSLSAIDMVIIAPPAFKREAERLGKEHESKDGLTVKVVAPEDIYNEFSSGTPDATAYRRFMKMLYDKAPTADQRPKYLLLFGDGAYDNRFVTEAWRKIRENEGANFLLTFQSENSLDADSYVTDDYFGFLEDSEGKSITDCTVDIGIGRFPVRSVAEARKVVDKVIRYMNNAELGIWKSETCFIADDGNNVDKNKGKANDHMLQADNAAKTVEDNAPEMLAGRLFFDNYTKDFSSSASYLAVTEEMNKRLRDGLLLINYTGHGSTTSWSDEQVLTQQMIDKFVYPKLPLWITATCDFCRFDALTTSAGESVFLNGKSGGIALYTTVRVAFGQTNEKINKSLLKELFRQDHRQALGDVVKQVKRANVSMDTKNLNFTFIGDPALKLALPTHKIRINTINGKDASSDAIGLRAYDEVKVEGEILAPDNAAVDGFNGKLEVKVMDSQIDITTRNNFRNDTAFTYKDYKNIVYKGSTQVQNGRFSFSFYVPGNISYSGNAGKMILYASDSEQKIEAKGSFTNYKVKGTSDNPLGDQEGPEILKLYLNDSTFVSGGQVNPTPFFYARLWDQTGVDITEGGIGHDVMLTIDNKPFTSYNLNAYYNNLFGRDGEGEVRFSVPELSAGMHEAVFKAWDIMGNPTTSSFRFEVVEGLKPFITNLVATPTPAKGNVRFHLSHNRPESQMKVGIMVYDISGRLHWKHEETGSSEVFKDYTIDWDLRNNSGSHVRPGVYIYRAAITTDNSKEATEAKKMIILW